jgi:hypothetical protein
MSASATARWSAATRARVAVLHHFLNFSIDAPMIHLFKLIDLSLELQYGTKLLVHHSIKVDR